MKPGLTAKQKTVRSIVWVSAGVIVLVVRGSLFPDAFSPFWIVIGGLMVAYGVASLAWVRLRKRF